MFFCQHWAWFLPFFLLSFILLFFSIPTPFLSSFFSDLVNSFCPCQLVCVICGVKLTSHHGYTICLFIWNNMFEMHNAWSSWYLRFIHNKNITNILPNNQNFRVTSNTVQPASNTTHFDMIFMNLIQNPAPRHHPLPPRLAHQHPHPLHDAHAHVAAAL